MILMFLIACLTTDIKQSEEEHDKQMKCISKRSGSQPECWDEKDWEIFCQRVLCKE